MFTSHKVWWLPDLKNNNKQTNNPKSFGCVGLFCNLQYQMFYWIYNLEVSLEQIPKDQWRDSQWNLDKFLLGIVVWLSLGKYEQASNHPKLQQRNILPLCLDKCSREIFGVTYMGNDLKKKNYITRSTCGQILGLPVPSNYYCLYNFESC